MKSDALVTQTLASRKIDLLGGTRRVKEICNLDYDSTVTRWRANGIPPGYELYLNLRFRKLFKEGGVL